MGKSVILFLAALIIGTLICWGLVLVGEYVFKVGELKSVGIMIGATILAGAIAALFK